MITLKTSVFDLKMELIQNFIDGQHISSDSSESLDIYEPATGGIYGQLRDSNANDIDLSLIHI